MGQHIAGPRHPVPGTPGHAVQNIHAHLCDVLYQRDYGEGTAMSRARATTGKSRYLGSRQDDQEDGCVVTVVDIGILSDGLVHTLSPCHEAMSQLSSSCRVTLSWILQRTWTQMIVEQEQERAGMGWLSRQGSYLALA